MKNIKFHSPRITAAFIILTCLAFSATALRANDDSKQVLISFDENFTSGSTIDGTTTLAGAFSDKGARHEDFTTQQHGNQVIVTGTVMITGSKGTLALKFTGAIPANGSNPNLIEGVESIVNGTGIYAGARGKGTFEATIDFDTGNIVGVAELELKK